MQGRLCAQRLSRNEVQNSKEEKQRVIETGGRMRLEETPIHVSFCVTVKLK